MKYSLNFTNSSFYMAGLNLIRRLRLHFFYLGGICLILHYFPSMDCNLIESLIWFYWPWSYCLVFLIRPFYRFCCYTLFLPEGFLVAPLFELFVLLLSASLFRQVLWQLYHGLPVAFVVLFPWLPYELCTN